MAYSDNYPNGYKSGYDSWDDPDRKDYSPYGLERARREAGSGIREETDVDRYWKRVREKQVEREQREAYETEQRISANARRDKEYEVAKIINHEKAEKYNSQSWLKKYFAKRKGKDFYTNQSEIYKESLEEAKTMSDLELDSIIRSGRSR